MVNKSGDLSIFIIIFVGLIIAVVFTAQIGTDTARQTSTIAVVNESLDISDARNSSGGGVDQGAVPVFTLTNNKNVTGNTPISSFSMINNNTGATVDAANYTIDLSFGNLTLISNDYWNSSTQGTNVTNITLVNYNYKHPDFVDDASSRRIILLILIFTALAALFFVIAMLFRKDSSLAEILKLGS